MRGLAAQAQASFGATVVAQENGVSTIGELQLQRFTLRVRAVNWETVRLHPRACIFSKAMLHKDGLFCGSKWTISHRTSDMESGQYVFVLSMDLDWLPSVPPMIHLLGKSVVFFLFSVGLGKGELS